jgi:hypothetical protein
MRAPNAAERRRYNPNVEGEIPMHDSKFWRSVAVLLVAALLYIGHGPHEGSILPTSSAYANGSDVQALGKGSLVYTSNAGGAELFVWRADGTGKATYLGMADANGHFFEGRTPEKEPQQ